MQVKGEVDLAAAPTVAQANDLLEAATSTTWLRTTIDAVNTNGSSATHVASATTRSVMGRDEEHALPSTHRPPIVPGLVLIFTCFSVLLLHWLVMRHGQAEESPTTLTGWRRARQLCRSRSSRRFAACANMRRRGSRTAVGLCLLFCCGGGWNVGLFASAADPLTDLTFKQASWGTCRTSPIVFAYCTHPHGRARDAPPASHMRAFPLRSAPVLTFVPSPPVALPSPPLPLPQTGCRTWPRRRPRGVKSATGM